VCRKLLFKTFISCDQISFTVDFVESINILTSGRFRSQKALDNKILSHTSKIGKNYHIGFFTISKCHSSLNYSTLRPMYNKCHECHNRRNNCCFRENIGITYKVRFSFILTTMPDSWFQRKKNFIYLQFLKVIVGRYLHYSTCFIFNNFNLRT
jgi:hypothetical protein